MAYTNMADLAANSAARPLHEGEKVGGNFRVATPLESQIIHQRKGYGATMPAALKIKAHLFVLKCCNGEAGVKKLIEKIYAQAMKGNFRAQELLLNYILGRPTERVKIENAQENGIAYNPTVRIIADHLRLEKLQRDADNAPTVVEENRVQEMESILNKEIEKPSPIESEEQKPTRAPRQKRNGVPTRKHKLKRATPKKGRKK